MLSESLRCLRDLWRVNGPTFVVRHCVRRASTVEEAYWAVTMSENVPQATIDTPRIETTPLKAKYPRIFRGDTVIQLT